MITLTLNIGATDISPIALAQFAATAVATGGYETDIALEKVFISAIIA